MSVKILVDSAADISQAEAKELGISLIPLKVYFGEEEYYDGVDLLPDQFFNKLIESDVLPKTSQITPFRFVNSLSATSLFTYSKAGRKSVPPKPCRVIFLIYASSSSCEVIFTSICTSASH